MDFEYAPEPVPEVTLSARLSADVPYKNPRIVPVVPPWLVTLPFRVALAEYISVAALVVTDGLITVVNCITSPSTLPSALAAYAL